MYITTNGISTYYERSGRGFPVVLLHALGNSMQGWAPVMSALSGSYDVIAYDWRGHGRTEKPIGEYSLPMMAQDLADLIDGLGLGRACVVGVAVGAMISLQATLDFPDKVAALVLSEGSSETAPGGSRYAEERAERIKQGGMRVAVDMTIERAFAPGYPEAHPEVMAEFRGVYLGHDPAGYARASMVTGDLNLTGRLGEIRCPTLLMVGEMDRLLPVAKSELIHRHIPGSRLVVLPGIGHFPYVEAPDLFARHLLEFLGQVAPAGR